MNYNTYHFLVSGKVQGVGFRHFTYQRALGLNVRGWVRNLSDGRVEAMVNANEEDIKKLERYLRKGPVFSRVDDLKIECCSQPIEFSTFIVEEDGNGEWEVN